jgi:hypothetical protein
MYKPLYDTVIAKQIFSQMFVELRYKHAVKLATSLSSKWQSNPCPSGTIFCGRSELRLVRTAAPSNMRQGLSASSSRWLDKKLHAGNLWNMLPQFVEYVTTMRTFVHL